MTGGVPTPVAVGTTRAQIRQRPCATPTHRCDVIHLSGVVCAARVVELAHPPVTLQHGTTDPLPRSPVLGCRHQAGTGSISGSCSGIGTTAGSSSGSAMMMRSGRPISMSFFSLPCIAVAVRRCRVGSGAHLDTCTRRQADAHACSVSAGGRCTSRGVVGSYRSGTGVCHFWTHRSSRRCTDAHDRIVSWQHYGRRRCRPAIGSLYG